MLTAICAVRRASRWHCGGRWDNGGRRMECSHRLWRRRRRWRRPAIAGALPALLDRGKAEAERTLECACARPEVVAVERDANVAIGHATVHFETHASPAAKRAIEIGVRCEYPACTAAVPSIAARRSDIARAVHQAALIAVHDQQCRSFQVDDVRIDRKDDRGTA